MTSIAIQDYHIYIGEVWSSLQTFLQNANYTKIAIIVDDNTLQHCLPLFRKNLPALSHFEVINIPPGEENKALATCQLIWQEMMDLGLDRKSLTINLGGGVIGDMGGFCASTFKRGMDFIQLPTTLLSQVDASIGGKLGIDFAHVKNSVGVFCNPMAVFIFPDFLQTLPQNETRSGFAEIIKHSLIADKSQWVQIKTIEKLQNINWTAYLLPSLEIKKRIVEEDPYEKGLRKALNYGHTIGHAIEGLFLPTEAPLLHGEAIAIGMICEAYLSVQQAGLSNRELEEIASFLTKVYGKIALQEADFGELIRFMRKDKKNEKGEINFTMLKAVGKALINQTSSEKAITESLMYYNQL